MANKRAQLIDQLLARPEFAEHWALKWSDLLRNEEKLLDAKGVSLFHQWLVDCFARDLPLDQFVRELVAARGSTYAQPAANFYRALRDPLARGEAAARLFLGVRLECAKCHNHPFDRWTQDDYYAWAAVFAHVDYEIVENNRKDKFDQHEFIGEQRVVWKTSEEVNDPRTGSAATPRFLAPQAPGMDAGQDRLPQLAQWLTSPANRAFAQAQANRIWFQLMGRGLVEPIDDFRVTNPPSHPELLDALAQELIASGYSLRHLVRQIMSSAVYQAQAIADEQHTMAAENYAGILPRRLSAEQLLDAQCQVLGTVAKFNGYPPGTEARQLAGTQRVRPREQRASQDDRFLTLFGKPARTMSCECERSDDTTLSQAFQLISGASLHDRLVDPQNRIARRLAAGANDDELVDELFWSALSRPATTAERTAAVRQVQASASRAEGFQDLAWALLNAKEFIYRP